MTGTFVDAHGKPCRRERTPVDVVRDGARLHVNVEGSGRGTVTLHGNTGTGTFVVLDGERLKLTVELDRRADRLTVRLRRDDMLLATATIRDLPP